MHYKAPIPAFIGGYTPMLIVAFILGNLLYFTLPYEPRVGVFIGLSTGLAGMGLWAIFFSSRTFVWYGGWVLLAMAFLGGGVYYSAYRTALVQPAFWPHDTKNRVWLKGTTTEVNLRSNGFATVHLRDVESYHQQKVEAWPRMVIVTHNSRAEEAVPGSQVAAQVQLKPPQAPLHPSGYDWRRNSYFEGVSAIGLVMGDFYSTPPEATPLGETLRTIREDVARGYMRGKHDPPGGVGAALLTGIRSGIPPETREHYTKSGLAHLMAISGMHLGMVAGFVYVLMRLLLVRMGHLPLYVDIRKPAAFLAFFSAVGYTLLAGTTIPTMRALSLIGAALLAILFDRLHLGVRILSFVAFGLVLYEPHWVAGPSFQLSFVASFALLLWAYRQREEHIRLGSLAPKASKISAIFKASFVATLATAPVVAVHFGQIPVYGVLANVIGVPYLGFIVLPLGFLSLLPLGLGEFIKPLFLLATKGLNRLAAFVAEQPTSTLEIPPEVFPVLFICVWCLLLAYIFRLWRLLWMSLLAAIPVYIAIATQQPAALLVYQEGEVVASPKGYVAHAQNKLASKALSDVAEILKKGKNLIVKCDMNYCSYRPHNHTKTLLTYAKPWGDIFLEDCHQSEWIFSREPTPCDHQNIWLHIQKSLEAKASFVEVKFTKNKLLFYGYKQTQTRPWQKIP